MQPVLERGSIDKPLTFDVGLIQLSFIPVCSPNTCNISVKIAPRVCTLVLFIIIVVHVVKHQSVLINTCRRYIGEPENDAGFLKHVAS